MTHTARVPAPPTSRCVRAFVACALLALVLALALQPAGVVLAHASLLRADPAPGGSFAAMPEAVTLWFSEPVEPRYSRVVVLRADGTRLQIGTVERATTEPDPTLRVALREDPGPGSYTVVWSTLSSVDGHRSDGFFSFTVGDALLPSPATEAALARTALEHDAAPLAIDAGVRWVNLLAQATVAGAVVFLLVVLLPVTGSTPARRWRGLFGVTLLALGAGHVAALVVQTIDATGGGLEDALGRPLLTLLTETRYGTLWLARAGLLGLLAALLWSATSCARIVAPDGRSPLLLNAAGTAAALALATTSLGSHAAAGSFGGSLFVLNDWLHLAATAVWVGGLLGLLVAAPGLDAGLRPVLERFSRLALGAVVVLLLTGLLAARRAVVGWDGIVATRYGMWLTLKLTLVVAALGLATWHLLVARPALGSAAGRVARGLRRTLRLEALLLAGVVAGAALLTATVPARDLLQGEAAVFGASRLTPEASVTFRASPGRIGTNELSVVVSPLDPATFGAIDRVLLHLTPPRGDALAPVQLRQAGPNDPYTFRTTGAYLATAGDWTLAVRIERPGRPALDVAFALTATRDGLHPTAVPGATAGDTVSPRATLLGAVWLLLAVTLAAGAWWSRHERRALARGLLALALVSLLTGSLLLVAGSAVAGG